MTFPFTSTREEKDEFVDGYLYQFGCRAIQRARDGYTAHGRGAVGHWVGESMAGPGIGFSVQSHYCHGPQLEDVFKLEPGCSQLQTEFSTYDPLKEALLFFSWPDGELGIRVIDLHHTCPTCGTTDP